MFCPQCRAEYRAGFTRCSDCDVDLVHDLPVLSTPKDRPNRLIASFAFPMHRGSVRQLIDDCRTTLRGWTAYKNQTGRLPWLSIVAHSANWFAFISGTIFVFSFADRFHWSGLHFLGVYVLVAIPYGILWYRLKREVKLNQLRTQRRLRREHFGH